MSVSDLSASTQNYLKAVWTLGEWSDVPVTPSLIAERTELKLSSVSDAVRKLTAQGLLNHSPYGAVELTDTGRAYAVDMVRRHRLIETFLVRMLGYGWDQVHDEAEHLEHAVSDFMIARIDDLLGHPTRDPHGDPIPLADGTIVSPDAVQLTQVIPGTRVTVERISDDEPALLQFFEDRGIVLGARLLVREGAPFSEAIDVLLEGEDQPIALGKIAAEALYVSRD
ncbi:metal-dependent transcriptional regulator [Leucobacter sp. UT-8R-CII-1-4]|uniref:metal-dependent transcriptional regulator n=1 Tax=Leucobacter sp. UT-8R-CII-1-4 TaxID=3040075 RepID=UPI0024A97299|nr:metal-dependent transcriptional regulator [Leucobacter sp. UT-8R-CII-1-4]MDI6022361.1 metal-dependent transcriptional regulator [Leucobacter sp. UT-8R-CII-1-4]